MMTIAILSLVVLFQVAVFQFVSAVGTRSFFVEELRAVPEGRATGLEHRTRQTARFRLALGALLSLVVVAILLGVPPDDGLRKVILAAVSLTSAAAFATANVHDRRTTRVLIESLPRGGVRHASLTPRSLRRWYPPALEAIPALVVVATAAFLWFGSGHALFQDAPLHTDVTDHRRGAILLLALQAVLVAGGLAYTLRNGVGTGSLAARLPSLRRRPEAALDLGERLAGTELRFFLAARILVALLLGVAAVGKALAAAGNPAAPWLDFLEWALVANLLFLFLGYLGQVLRLSRRVQHEVEQAGRPETGGTA